MNENGTNIPNDIPEKEPTPSVNEQPSATNTARVNPYSSANGAGARYNMPGSIYSHAPAQPPVQPPVYQPVHQPVHPPVDSPVQGTTEDKKDTKSKKGKRSKGDKGFIAFMVIAIVMSVFAIGFCVYMTIGKGAQPPMEHVAGADDTQITLNASPVPSGDSSSLSTIQIAESAEKINVGIMIYGKTNSFISSSSTSLIGEGSGIVMGVDKTNTYTYIITCAHVISEASNSGYTMTVQDSDGNTYDGIMVGYDAKTDIGVIKIAATGLQAAEFGDSSSLKKGQKVYAIGNPGGMEFFGSFTDGMVSSIDRPISSESGYEMKCIQHTTPINSGNSGGALLNEFGQVVGINSSKIVSTGYEGMAFAIPISDAKPIIDDLIVNGYVTNRPKLGISYTAAMQYQQYAMIIKQNNLPAGSLVIRDISPDSSLASTKVELYDLIIAVDGVDLDSADVLLDKIENGKVGDEITLTICRIDGEDYSVSKFDVKVKLVEDTGTVASNQSQQSENYWDDYFGN